ncbi:cupin domain-containing protein [uncultured Alistipes sp.]|uniref:cupin domain-containing protein n=1 Tax=uncultured Alistipes sp. TaxID=538949 RepID=UPI00204ACA74|nr:cupin domain-containing protein [uncultured Alistipes sp.]DAN30532.1 MAG TPA: Mannose-6-phosphate isomerase [Crassvirales sp.]
MKTTYMIAGLLCLVLTAGSCCRQQPAHTTATDVTVVLKDYGAEPTVLNIEKYTLSNENFRTAIWTGRNLQVTLMSIPVGGDVGLEQHHDIDQFLRIEEGIGQVLMGDSADKLDFVREVSDDYAVFVPAGKWHNIVNKGDKPLKIYSIYAPAEHPHGTVHKTQQEAIEAEHAH